jgi:hypothetical protein
MEITPAVSLALMLIDLKETVEKLRETNFYIAEEFDRKIVCG